VQRRVVLDHGSVVTVRDWPGDGQPIVLLHGLLDSAAGWDELARAMPGRCLAVDLPGFGGSDPPQWPRFSAYAAAVVEALGRLDVRRFTLVGHSLGGGVATAVAERRPEAVSALVLCAPAGYGRIPLAEVAALPAVRALTVAALPYLVTRTLLLDAVYASWVTNGVSPTQELRRRLAADAARFGPGVSAALEALAAAGLSPRAYFRRPVMYDGPVSAVWGDRDALVPARHRHALRMALPHAEVHVWRAMGHHPQRERPAELTALVRASHASGSRPASACGGDRLSRRADRPRQRPHVGRGSRFALLGRAVDGVGARAPLRRRV
jgi:pimeloyl-ACP methyl ester carboxylesterase